MTGVSCRSGAAVLPSRGRGRGRGGGGGGGRGEERGDEWGALGTANLGTIVGGTVATKAERLRLRLRARGAMQHNIHTFANAPSNAVQTSLYLVAIIHSP